jgi:hypothetical protein
VRRNPVLDVVLDELAAAGIKPTVRQNGHIKVRWMHGGEQRTCVVPVSPSDSRAPLHARAWVRRQLRTDGIGRTL